MHVCAKIMFHVKGLAQYINFCHVKVLVFLFLKSSGRHSCYFSTCPTSELMQGHAHGSYFLLAVPVSIVLVNTSRHFITHCLNVHSTLSGCCDLPAVALFVEYYGWILGPDQLDGSWFL